MPRPKGNIRSRLAKVEEALSATDDRLEIVAVLPDESERDALRRAGAEGASQVIFVTMFGQPGEGPSAEIENVDAAIEAEIKELQSHGFSEEEIRESLETPTAPGAEGSRRIKSGKRPARPVRNGGGPDGPSGDGEPSFGSSELTRLFGR